MPAIADPIEQAFFVLVHLLYLQPFAMLNMSMACLAVLLEDGRPLRLPRIEATDGTALVCGC